MSGVETVRQPHHFQTNSKGFGNINQSVDEAGDIFCGWNGVD
jgi:hypothetical protein